MKKEYSVFITIILVVVLTLTIGYSAFERNLLLDDIALTVRPVKDIRVTGTWQKESTNGAESDSVDYNVKSSILSFNLPRESSTITYTVQVTNIGNVDMGIFQITGLLENMEYELTNYTLKEKICNEQRCNNGIQKEFQITIKYKSGSYQSSNTSFNVNLNFDFRSYHTVTYEDFESPTTSYPTEVMDGDDYNFTFPETAPKELQVLMGGAETSFDYADNRLIVRNVTDDLKITSINKPKFSFATDDWDVIKENIDSDVYNVGDEREVELKGFGTFTLRLVNTSTPPKCEDPNFSQTACGFVVEFEDIITTHAMNTSGGTYGTNVGGWPASEMKDYLDSTIFPALPSELQAVIIKTKSISGHGSNDKGDGPNGNFVSSNDKLYLLSPHEVWENGTSNTIDYDTAWDYTRQLDYYFEKNTTTDNYSPAIKKNSSNSNALWWLRGARSLSNIYFYYVRTNGNWDNYRAYINYSVAPAFRIGEAVAEPEEPEVTHYFATDDWETIKENIDTDRYNVGDEREVELEGFGTFTLRLVNKSTPSACEDSNFSQTACGFVVEFEDIITTHNMNPSNTNKGGWPASAMKEYLDSTIFPALPSELQTVIIETKSISGHGSSDTGDGPGSNWVSNNDKLYLLSPHEVWENGTSNKINYDSAWDYTRQLDYYYGVNTTTNNYSPAIKKDSSNSNAVWWLRGANSNSNSIFYYVNSGGGWNSYYAGSTSGVSPAFRIG